MISLLIKLVILFIIIIFIKSIINIHKYNDNATLITIDNINKILKNKKILDPILLKYDNDINDINFKDYVDNNLYKYYNQYDTIIRLSDFYLQKDVYIYKNKDLLIDFNMKKTIENIHDIFSTNLSNNINYYMSIFQGSNKINIQKNKHDITLIYNIDGDVTINLLNPKHKEHINYNENIEKWCINIDMKKGDVLYIPCEWYYIFDVKDNCKLLHAESDTYFTSIYNEYRN
jgi:hypothetical protein